MARGEIDKEDEIRFECPSCGTEIDPWADPDAAQLPCPHCGEAIDLLAQQALARAVVNYHSAQELTTAELFNSKKRLSQLSPQSKDALRTYQKSYNSVRLALHNQLPAAQQRTAIEIMAEIARILPRHHMISALEARYWAQLMVCRMAQEEYEAIQARLHQPRPKLLTRLVRHPHWRLRRFQLKRALVRREKRLQELERDLAFVDNLQVRRGQAEL